jgi:putative NADPH-quinone reductase
MHFFSDLRKKKIVILCGHPDKGDTLTGQLTLLYETAAKQAGHEVKRFNVCDLKFDPILHRGYRAIQELEPDLIKFQEAVRWCDHFVILYPVWWSAMPALLKGFFDRVWLPSFAYNMRKTKDGVPLVGWRKRLKGKTARVIAVSGSHPLIIWLFFGDYTNEIKRAMLWFAGFKVKMSLFGPSEIAPEWKKNEWRKKVALLGKLGE